MKEAVNLQRRAERTEMAELGFNTKKQYRKWQKKERRFRKSDVGVRAGLNLMRTTKC